MAVNVRWLLSVQNTVMLLWGVAVRTSEVDLDSSGKVQCNFEVTRLKNTVLGVFSFCPLMGITVSALRALSLHDPLGSSEEMPCKDKTPTLCLCVYFTCSLL